jgi:hypothetical protein
MYISFNSLPPTSRIWIYQSNREFTVTEIAKIGSATHAFLNSWTSHDEALPASYTILYNRFLVIAIDDSQVSAGGCSIDKSMHFIQQLEKEFSVSLTDRWLFAFRKGDQVQAVKRDEFEALVEKGEITEDTIVFNNLIQSKAELSTKWEVPLKHSWHKALLEV